MAIKAQLEPTYYLSGDATASHVHICNMTENQLIPDQHTYISLLDIPLYDQYH